MNKQVGLDELSLLWRGMYANGRSAGLAWHRGSDRLYDALRGSLHQPSSKRSRASGADMSTRDDVMALRGVPAGKDERASAAESGQPVTGQESPIGPIVLFDGVCNLCNATVRWIIERDRRKAFRFASLQSRAAAEAGGELSMLEHGRRPDSVVLIDAEGTHTRSEAAIRIGRHLGFPWSLAGLARILPRALRDAVYSGVARNRYRWFGRRDACQVPTPELRARFLDADEPRPAVVPPEAMEPELSARASPVSVAMSLALRWVLAFWVISIFPFPLGLIPRSEPVWKVYESMLHTVVPWLGRVVFGVEITVFPNGSGDTTYNYVELFMYVALAGLVAVAWTAAQRGRAVSCRVLDSVTTYVRYCLGVTMLSYGWAKLVPMQMPVPGPDRLLSNVGDMSPMGLVWLFMGASTPYQMFAGFGEVVGGVLLLFRRTTLAGALISGAVLTNVVAINFCFDVPVKLFSSQLLLMAVFLAAPHAPRLLNVLFLNLPAQPCVLRPFPVRSGARRWVYGIVKASVVFAGAVYPAYQSWEFVRADGLLSPVKPWHGMYRVESFIRDGVADRALEDGVRWIRVGIDSDGVATVQRADGTTRRQRMEFDPEKGVATISRRGEPHEMKLAFALVEPGVLTLEGEFEGGSVIVRMRRIDDGKPLLTGRGFHWINEFPLNR